MSLLVKSVIILSEDIRCHIKYVADTVLPLQFFGSFAHFVTSATVHPFSNIKSPDSW